MTSKATLFQAAWSAARQGAAKFGGKTREYFREALKMAHAFFREQDARKAAHATANAAINSPISKLSHLAGVVFEWPAKLRGSFAYRFITDNYARLEKYGPTVKFSDKQIAIINDMYAKYA